MAKLKILIACEFSGIVRDAFAARGHNVWSCDLLPTERPGQHIQGDVLKLLQEHSFDMMIAHPPCTYLANSGVQHLGKVSKRWFQMLEARQFFMELLIAPIERIAIENPIPHGYADLPNYQQIVQPFYFGDPQQKKTCLWLKNLPPLMSTLIVERGEQYIGKDGRPNGSKWYQLPPSVDRWKHRSKTFLGLANAMANQWG